MLLRFRIAIHRYHHKIEARMHFLRFTRWCQMMVPVRETGGAPFFDASHITWVNGKNLLQLVTLYLGLLIVADDRLHDSWNYNEILTVKVPCKDSIYLIIVTEGVRAISACCVCTKNWLCSTSLLFDCCWKCVCFILISWPSLYLIGILFLGVFEFLRLLLIDNIDWLNFSSVKVFPNCNRNAMLEIKMIAMKSVWKHT